ncbi:MAG: hypothetical protein JWP63_1573 [Candidatus Solibacter sp.]|nr:hypothetical protein [Candidatus Solibacter sp.]
MTPLSILDYRQPVEFRIGEVIIRSWNVLSRHFLTFVLLVGIAEVLPLVLTLYWQRMNSDLTGVAVVAQGTMVTAGIGLLQFILTSFAQAIVVFAAFQDLRGRPVSAAESFRQGVGRLFPVILSSVLTGLVIGVGFLLCIVPGLIAIAAFAVVLPACVVERLGPIESMHRSADLTTGHRWPIMGAAAAWLVIIFVVTLTIQAAMPGGAASLPKQLATWVWQVLSGSYTAVYAAILYHDLRAVRDGIGIDEIASVFD